MRNGQHRIHTMRRNIAKKDTHTGMFMCVIGGLVFALGLALDTTWSLALCGFGGALAGSGSYRIWRARCALRNAQTWEQWRHQ